MGIVDEVLSEKPSPQRLRIVDEVMAAIPFSGVEGAYSGEMPVYDPSAPTEAPTSVNDFVGRVVPESIYKTTIGALEFPGRVGYGIGQQIQEKGIEQGSPVRAVAGVGEEIGKNLVGMGHFIGEPVGAFGLEKAKEKWSTDPAGSIMAVAPIVGAAAKGGMAIRETVANRKRTIVDEVVKPVSSPVAILESEAGSAPMITRAAKEFKEFFSPLTTLPQSGELLASRYHDLYGGIARVDSIVAKMADRFKNVAPETKTDIFNALRGEFPVDQLPQETRLMVGQTRADLNRVGKMLVKRGLLSEETFLANKDNYIHYMYLRHILPDDAVIPVGRTGRLDLGYLKARKDLTDLQRRELGLIEDVSVAAPVGVGKALGDIVKHDYYGKIAENPDWVWRPSKEIAELVRSEKVYRQMVDRGAANAETVAKLQELQSGLKAATEAAGKVPEDFKQLPDNKSFGPLAGVFVRKEIYNDIVPLATLQVDAGRLASIAQKTVEGGMTVFKIGKVAVNPPTMVRNTISNFIQMNMSGIPFYQIPDVVGSGISSFIKKDKFYQQLKRNGGLQTNWSAAELGEVMKLFEQAKGGNVAKVFSALKGAAKYYGKIDDIAKLSIYRHAVEKQGMSPVDAAVRAQKWGMDYSLASRSIKYARRYALPFVSYQYKIAPLIAETLATRPWVLAKYAAIPYALSQWAAYEFDWTDKDLDKAQKMMAERTKGQGAYTLLPVKDNKGHVQIVNLEYYLPWGNWMETARSAGKGNAMDALKQFGFGGPYANIIAMVTTKKDNKPPVDPFTGRPIYSPLDDPKDKYLKTVEWWWQSFGPQSFSSKGALGYTVDAIKGEKDRWGVEATPEKAFLKWMGANVGSLSEQQIMSMRKFNLRELDNEMIRLMRDPKTNAREKAEALKRLREQKMKIIRGEQ